MNKTILTDITISDLTKETVKKLTYKLRKVVNSKAKTPLSHSDVCEIVAQVLEFESWNHLASALSKEESVYELNAIKIQFVHEFLNTIKDDETYLDVNMEKDFPYSYCLFDEGCECNFEDESEATLDMFNAIVKQYSKLTCWAESEIWRQILAKKLSGQICAEKFNADLNEESEVSLISWLTEDKELLQKFKSLTQTKIEQLVSDLKEHNYDGQDMSILYDVVNDHFSLGRVSLVFPDGSVESSAFNYLDSKLSTYFK